MRCTRSRRWRPYNSPSTRAPSCGMMPVHTTSTVRPPARRSRLAHWYASSTGSRSGKLAIHAGPMRTRCVRAATPPSSAMDSMRGLPSSESPTQTDWNTSDSSAMCAIFSICSGVVTPNSTPRFGKVSPKRIARYGSDILAGVIRWRRLTRTNREMTPLGQFDLHYAYLVGALLFVPVWLLMYWRSPTSRREMLVMSGVFTITVGVPLEFWLYSRDWWHPLTITRTAIGIEDVIYSIGNGGYLAAVYAFTFRGYLDRRQHAPGWQLRLLPLVVAIALPLILAYALGWPAFPAATVGSLIALAIVLAARRDLIAVAVGSA